MRRAPALRAGTILGGEEGELASVSSMHSSIYIFIPSQSLQKRTASCRREAQTTKENAEKHVRFASSKYKYKIKGVCSSLHIPKKFGLNGTKHHANFLAKKMVILHFGF
jgi:hypothetical protein